MKKFIKTSWPYIVVFIIAITYVIFREKSLSKHGILLNAKTIEWTFHSNNTVDLRYQFTYNREKVVDNNATGVYSGKNEFIGKYFPVIYDPILKMSELLVTPSDFKKYNLLYPDSLRWVLPFLK